MSFYRDYVLPRLVERTLSNRQAERLRQSCLAGLSGTVLEIGFGSGLNLPFYPEAVDRLLACDPSEGARNLAKDRLDKMRIPVEFVGLQGEEIPLDDESVDNVVTTWTLCTIPDAMQAMKEVRRVLRAGGRFHFMEHGRARDESLARWQDWLTPFQKLVGGGCHLNRRIDDIILSSGFDMRLFENFFIKGPRIGSFMYRGVAERNGVGQ